MKVFEVTGLISSDKKIVVASTIERALIAIGESDTIINIADLSASCGEVIIDSVSLEVEDIGGNNQ